MRAARAIALALLVLLMPAPACSPPSYETAITEARRALDRGRTDDALERLQALRRRHPERREPYVLIATLCEAERRPEPGIVALRDAVARRDEHLTGYLLMLAILEEMADERASAEAHYRECLELDPDLVAARSRLARFLTEAGRLVEARSTLEPALEGAVDAVVALQYAEILLRSGSPVEAERHVGRVLAADPDHVDGHYLAGLVELQLQRSEPAARHLAAVTDRDPEHYRAWYQLARALSLADDAEGARRALERFEPPFRSSAGSAAASGTEATALAAGDETRPTLDLDTDGRASVALRGHDGHLVVAFAGDGTTREIRAGVRFRGGGREWTLLDVAWQPDGDRWREWIVALPADTRGVDGRVDIEAAATGGGWTAPFRDAPRVRVAVPSSIPSRPVPGVRPNIILVSVDTLRADRLGCYGNERDSSPATDRMAREGVRFPVALAPSNWTLPSHYSMLSSLYPSAHGVNPDRGLFGGYRDPTRPVRVRGSGREEMLAERLAALGYFTAAITENGWVHPRFGFDQGFASFVADTAATLASTQRRTLEWLELHRDLPFFLFVHTYQPHQPYDSPEAYESRYAPAGHIGYALPGVAAPVDVLRDFRPGFFLPMAADVDAFRALYDAEVRYVDAFVEALLGALESNGIADRTVVVLTSDHGEEIFEHGRFDHGDTLHREVMEVPLIFWGPGVVGPGGTPSVGASLLDLVPTLVELAGGEVDGPVQGRSLVPWLHGDDGRDATRLLFAEGFAKEFRAIYSVRDGRHAYLVTEGKETREELYDLRSDPGETRDVSDARPEITARLRAAVARWREENEALGQLFVADDAEIDDELRERLRSLGYL